MSGLEVYTMLLSPPLSPCEPKMDSQVGEPAQFNIETFSQREPIPLQPRFAEIKKKIVSGGADAIAVSWNRLLRELKREIELIFASDPEEIIPSIDFEDIHKPSARAHRENFSRKLRHRGVAIIRGVIPAEQSLSWKRDVEDYLCVNQHARTSAPRPHGNHHWIYDMFWSPTQIQARAHPNVLAAQKFAMSHWHTPNRRSHSTASAPPPLVNTAAPIAYADRLLVQRQDTSTPHATGTYSSAQVDNGSVERWETDGYGRSRAYTYIFEGWWEGHDPWDASARAFASPDLYGGAGRCSAFRMFHGWLSLGGSEDPPWDFQWNQDTETGNPSKKGAGLAVVPLLKHATAYFLLRPFFAPRTTLPTTTSTTTAAAAADTEAFLSETNWTLVPPERQDSVLHGALPSYAQEINDLLHPHLRLGRSLVPVPALNPGDYLIWHPDLIHASAPPTPPDYDGDDDGDDGAMMLCLPACPLTQTNALYLAQQRKAFLLGNPGPDFAGGPAGGGGGGGGGESFHVGRPGVQDVSEAGGEDGLRAMGLYPWDEGDAWTEEGEREVLAMANRILFPDRFGVL